MQRRSSWRSGDSGFPRLRPASPTARIGVASRRPPPRFQVVRTHAPCRFADAGVYPVTCCPLGSPNPVLYSTPEARDDVMTMTTTDNLSIARKYLEALESGAEGGALADYFTADVVQEEYPNRLAPIGAHRDLKAILDAAKKGKKTLRAQKFDVMNSIA